MGRWLGLFAVLALGSVGSGPSPQLPSDHLPVPIVRQSTDYSCGAAASLAILQYWQLWEDGESSLFSPLKTTTTDGTHPKAMADFLALQGLDVETREGVSLDELRQALGEGKTTILALQAWRDDESIAWKDAWEDGHYVVLIGMDAHFAYFMDPVLGSQYGFIPLTELEERWHDYEIESGTPRRYEKLALFVKGARPRPHFPDALGYVE